MLRELRRGSVVSRRDLAERLGVARSTAGRRVDSLIERGFLEETGIEERREAGRPRRFLQLCGGFGKFVGFDFDARHLHAVLVDFDRRTLAERSVALPRPPDKGAVIDLLREWIECFEASAAEFGGGPVLGYGFGVPGRVRTESRLSLGYPYIAGWVQVDLSSELGLPRNRVRIENNTRAIALGEYWLGDSPAENLLCLNVRTGISVAVVAEGRLLRGHHEMAGEIRAWRVPSEPGEGLEAALEGPSAGWLEERATVRAVVESWRSPVASGDAGEPSGEPDARAVWRRFAEACREGEEGALARLRELACYHGEALARLVQLVDPQMVAVAGEFNDIGEVYLSNLRDEVSAALQGHYFEPPPIRYVTKGRFAGAHGAAALAAEHYRPMANA